VVAFAPRDRHFARCTGHYGHCRLFAGSGGPSSKHRSTDRRRQHGSAPEALTRLAARPQNQPNPVRHKPSHHAASFCPSTLNTWPDSRLLVCASDREPHCIYPLLFWTLRPFDPHLNSTLGLANPRFRAFPFAVNTARCISVELSSTFFRKSVASKQHIH